MSVCEGGGVCGGLNSHWRMNSTGVCIIKNK